MCKHIGCSLAIVFTLFASSEITASVDNASALRFSAAELDTHHDLAILNNRRCTDCHSYDPLFSHPVDVVPPASMLIPTNLPLDNGRVTCVTCHANVGKDDSQNQFNKPEVGYGLCIQCHDSSGNSAVNMHSIAVGKAHLPFADKKETSQNLSLSQIPGWVDSESASCLSCHDGAVASSSGIISGSGHGNLFGSMGSEHPIGAYQLTDQYNSDGPLRPATMLDERVRLFGNHVGCGSCHSVYSQEPGLLVMSNEGSKLCLACHEY